MFYSLIGKHLALRWTWPFALKRKTLAGSRKPQEAGNTAKISRHLNSLLILLLLTLFVSATDLAAHHPSGISGVAGSNPLPADRATLDFEYRKGERGNRNVLLSRAGVELSFLDDFSWRLELGHIAFSQKDAPDAARWLRPRTGLRYSLDLHPSFLLVLDGDIGFASSGNSMIDEPFYDSQTGITAGYIYESFTILARLGGIFPIGGLPDNRQQTAYPWQEPETRVDRELFELEKVTQVSIRIAYRWDWFEPFAGGLYRKPHSGVLIEKGESHPEFYRHWEVGSGFYFGDWHVSLAYQKPFTPLESYDVERFFLSPEGLPTRRNQEKLQDEILIFSVAFHF
ncbi:MAG: hypothetical protein CMN77_12720 [Spirochaetaceae bacterium]|nr:hypothetical protein [Spirochaetaceae bacterium]|tara:strand:+ start:9228 stop:10250 length:1023 start_codon:yes stop_codon:yes gene_type:complete